jgi:hypothetical protein
MANYPLQTPGNRKLLVHPCLSFAAFPLDFHATLGKYSYMWWLGLAAGVTMAGRYGRQTFFDISVLSDGGAVPGNGIKARGRCAGWWHFRAGRGQLVPSSACPLHPAVEEICGFLKNGSGSFRIFQPKKMQAFLSRPPFFILPSVPIRLLAKNASGVSVAKRASLAVQPHDQNHQPGRAGAAAPPMIPIQRPALDENDLPVVNQPDRHATFFLPSRTQSHPVKPL